MTAVFRSAAAALAIWLVAVPALAEEAPAGIKRTPLQGIDFPEGYRTVTGLAEIAPGGASGAGHDSGQN